MTEKLKTLFNKVYNPTIRSRIIIMKMIPLLSLFISIGSCSDFVEVEPPKNLLTSEIVFNDPATIESAVANMLFKLREQGSMVSGRSGLTTMMGIYSDELDYYGFDSNISQFYYHNVTTSNSLLLTWWANSYNLIYAANDLIKGVEKSRILKVDQKARFKGTALFIRAYVHSLLSQIYGAIPYIKSTNYIENNVVTRVPVQIVYENIISDLRSASSLLEGVNISPDRLLPDYDTVLALLSRIYLYTENWEMAESIASELIEKYTLEDVVNDVFLKESTETIWQLKPGDNPKNTYEANQLIIQVIPGQQFALTESLLNAFEPNDLRLENWVDNRTSADGQTTLYFAHKYKASFAETKSFEYSVVFRLAEQFLIRAESRAHLGNIDGAQQDLNKIRNRAGLNNISAKSVNALLEAILLERRLELFAEHGQRWFDLKRTGNVGTVLSSIKSNWEEKNILLPIPDSEMELNPNLLPQNTGY